jgi:hypothetical protein
MLCQDVYISLCTTIKTSSSRYSSSDDIDEDSLEGEEEPTRIHDEVRTSSASQGNRQHGRRNDRISISKGVTPNTTRVSSSVPPRTREYHSQNGSEYEDRSVGGSSSGSLAYVQLDAYTVHPKELIELHDTLKNNISRIVRSQVFPRVKFLPKSGKEHEKIFGSFWRPDLLVNTPKYVDVILDNFGDLKQRREDESILTDAVQFWVMAAPMVRQVILDRRSNVTQRMKRELVIGKSYNALLCAVVTIILI